VIVAWGARQAWPSATGVRRWVAAAGVAVCLVMALMTAQQVSYWKDSVSLWAHAVAVTTDNPRAQTNYGFALAEAGQRTRALAAYREAIRLEPTYPNASAARVRRGPQQPGPHPHRPGSGR
jgi:tetratricopeptide (TPR) repeat protein